MQRRHKENDSNFEFNEATKSIRIPEGVNSWGEHSRMQESKPDVPRPVHITFQKRVSKRADEAYLEIAWKYLSL